MRRWTIVSIAVILVAYGLFWHRRPVPGPAQKADVSEDIEAVASLDAADCTRDFGVRVEVWGQKARVYQRRDSGEHLDAEVKCLPEAYLCESAVICDGGRLVMCSISCISHPIIVPDNKVMVFSTKGLRHLATIPYAAFGCDPVAGFDSDQIFAVMERDREKHRTRVALMGAKDGRESFSQWVDGDAGHNSLGVSDDANTFCVCLPDRCTVFRREAGAVKATDYALPVGREIATLALSRRGRAVAVTCYDGSVHAMNFETRTWRSYTELKRDYTPQCLAVADAGDRVFVYQCADPRPSHIFAIDVRNGAPKGAMVVADLPHFQLGFRLAEDEKSASWTGADGLTIWHDAGQAAENSGVKKSK